MAESGGGGPRTTGRVERLEKGVWVALEGWSMMTAIVFADETRVLLGSLLVPQEGAPVTLDCQADLRVAPGDTEIFCVSTYQADAKGADVHQVRVKRFDQDGKLLGTRTVEPPLRVEGGRPAFESVSTEFLGFGPRDGLFFSTYLSSSTKPHGPGVPDGCDAFSLSTDDKWLPAGKLAFVGGDYGKCGNADVWAAEGGLPVRPGKRPRPWD